MPERVYRLPRNRPVVWRTPHSLSVGVDQPAVVVTDIPDAASPLIHALHEGIGRSGFVLLATQLGLDTDHATRLLDQLLPACRAEPVIQRPRVCVLGDSESTTTLASRLSGVSTLVETRESADYVLVVSDYVVHPDWIRELSDGTIRHVPVLFSDLTVTIGPVITPGVTPCLYCLSGRRDQDDAEWLSIQSQLFHTPSPLAAGHTADIAASLVVSLLPEVLCLPTQWDYTPGHTRFRYRPATATLTTEAVDFDPECRCRGL